MRYTERLTREQRSIVEALHGPVLVVAGVGSGKTHVLAERAAHALHRGVAPGSMLAITFTNRAAREMRARLAALVGPQGAEMAVTTFHALCVRILRRDGKLLAIDPAFAVWDETDSAEALRLAAAEIHLALDDRGLRDCGTRIRTLKGRRRYPQNLGDRDPGFLALYRAYQHILATSNALDFADLVAQTWTLFRHDTATRLAWAERCGWVEIDEFQDTDDSEYDIFHLLTREHENVCAFGDTAQWIYRWRGVDGARVLARFRDDFPRHMGLALNRNFRSTPTILAVARAVLHDGVGAPVPQDLVGGAIPVHACRDERDEREYLARRARELHAGGLPWRGVAVLTRTNRDVAALAEAFVAADVPVATVAATEFFRRAEVKDLAAYLRLVAAPHDVLALRRVANLPARGLSPAFLSRVERDGRACGLLLTDLVDPGTLREGDPCAWELGVAGREFVALDCEATGLDPAVDEPVTVAAVRVDGATGAEEAFAAILRPDRAVGASAGVHGLSDADLAARGQDPAGALAAFRAFVGRRPLVGHNLVNYDLPLLDANLARHSLRPLHLRAADTLWLARRALDLDRYNLERVREACGVVAPVTHQALDDARCAAACFRVLAARLAATAPARCALVAEVGERFAPLADLVDRWRTRADASALSELVEAILSESGYVDMLRGQGRSGERRLATLEQLRALIVERFDPLPPERALRAFLDHLSLAKSADRIGAEEDRVLLLTIHAAKGLEFDAVLIAGAHDGGLPAHWSLRDADELAEERRLLYVGMTRARRVLELTYPRVRTRPSGRTVASQPSRFLATVPAHLMTRPDVER